MGSEGQNTRYADSVDYSLLIISCILVCMGRYARTEPKLLLQLYGAASLALVVGYISGLRRLGRGDDIRNIVWVGITSNGSASLILFLQGIAGTWEEWGTLAQDLFVELGTYHCFDYFWACRRPLSRRSLGFVSIT